MSTLRGFMRPRSPLLTKPRRASALRRPKEHDGKDDDGEQPVQGPRRSAPPPACPRRRPRPSARCRPGRERPPGPAPARRSSRVTPGPRTRRTAPPCAGRGCPPRRQPGQPVPPGRLSGFPVPSPSAAHQPAIRLSRSVRTASPWRGEGARGLRPRLYSRGEQPMTLLKAVLKALSDA